jgi:hypothetical protein
MSTLIAILVCAALFAVFALARIRHTDCGGSCGSCTHACSRGEEDHAHR